MGEKILRRVERPQAVIAGAGRRVPPAGNQPSQKEKIASSTIPSQNSGHGAGGQHQRDRGLLHDGAPTPCEVGAGQDAEGIGNDQRGKGEDQRVGQERYDTFGDGLAVTEALAEFALQEIAQVDEVLLPQRLIEPELRHQRVLLLGGEGGVDIGRPAGCPASAGTSGTGSSPRPRARDAS